MNTRVLALGATLIAGLALFFFWPQPEVAPQATPRRSQGTSAPTKPASSTSGAETTSLRGQVQQAGGLAIHGAYVQLLPAQGSTQEVQAHDSIVTSDAKGAWKIPSVPPGDYVLSASAPGFLPSQKLVQLKAGQEQEVLLQLKAGGHALSGEVRDLTGGVVAAAIIHVFPLLAGKLDRTQSASALADSKGLYKLHLAPGRYLLWGFHSDYVPSSKVVEMTSAPRSVDFALAPGAAIEGVVKRIGDQTPVPNAVVQYSSERSDSMGIWANSSSHGNVVADDQGAFRITGLNSGALQLTAQGSRSATSEPTRVALGIAEQVSEVELFVTEAFSISGKVIDAETGDLVVGISVSANSEGNALAALAASDEQGNFRIDSVVPGTYRLTGSGGAYTSEMFGVKLSVEADIDNAVLKLKRGVMIRGHVKPPQLAEVGIVLDTIEGMSSIAFSRVQSQEDGSFDLGPLEPGQFGLQARSRTGGLLGHTEVTLPPAGLNDIVIVLQPSASLAGKVLDSSGTPVADVVVQAKRVGQASTIIVNGEDLTSQRAHTDAEGRFRIDHLVEGKYALHVLDDQGQALAWAKKTQVTTVSLTAQEVRTDLLLEVEARNARLTGVVLGPDGSPARDVWVSASTAMARPMGMPPMPHGQGQEQEQEQEQPEAGEASEEERSETRMMVMVQADEGGGHGPGLDLGRSHELPPVLTDERGHFIITGLRTGKYNLVGEGLRGSARGFLKHAEASKAAAPVTLKLESLTRIEGSVGFADKPVQDFVVELSGSGHRRKHVHNKAGRFVLHRVDPGNYEVSVRSKEGQAIGTVEVVAGKVSTLDMQLETLTTIRGRLLGEDGAPISGALIVPAPDRGDGNIQMMVEDDVEVTAEDGSFEVGVRPGKYLLMAIKPGLGPLARRSITVAEGETTIDVGDLITTPSADKEPEDEPGADSE